MRGKDPPVALLTHLTQERSGSIIMCGVCVSGRDEVRTFDAWWGLEIFKLLSQIANPAPQTLGELVMVNALSDPTGNTSPNTCDTKTVSAIKTQLEQPPVMLHVCFFLQGFSTGFFY